MVSFKPQLAPPLGLCIFTQLIVRHPHYNELNTLLKIPALEKEDTVDYDTALTLCGIISDNSYNSGWFARSKDGKHVCDRGSPLKAGEVFYFATADKSYKYPICPTWDEWCVPSTDSALPSAFASFTIPPPPSSLRNGVYMSDVKFRDASCRVTGVYDGCEQAHLVPASARDWWDGNMAGISSFEIESAQNGILLRVDLHRLFDLGAWVPMIKESKIVVHVLRNSDISNQFIEIFHNREMQEFIGIDKKCLFARIAWSLLPMLSDFLSGRRLAKENTLFKIGDETKEWTPDACKLFKIKPRSRNPSPTKRPRLEQVEENGLVVDALWHEDEETEDENHDNATIVDSVYNDDSPRGRKRLRSSSRNNIYSQKQKQKQKHSLAALDDQPQRQLQSIDYPSLVSF